MIVKSPSSDAGNQADADVSTPSTSTAAAGSPTRPPRREPEVVNPRAAALESLGGSTRDRREPPRDSRPSSSSSSATDNRGPPPVRNKMFEQLADEERAAAAQRTRDRDDNRDNQDSSPSFRRGPPPPVANSRFAAAAEADRSPANNPSYERGPPPPVANSRFAAAAAMAEDERQSSYRGSGSGGGGGDDFADRDNRGPPPVANSRFAAAAAWGASDEGGSRRGGGDRDRDNRDSNAWDGERRDYRDHQRGPPPVQQNSRFAVAVSADPDYVDRDERERRRQDRDDYRDGGRGGDYRDGRGGGGGGDRFRGGFGGRDGQSLPQSRASLPTGPRGEEYGGNFAEAEQRVQEQQSRVADVLKPKAPPPTENILQFPTKAPAAPEHADNVLKIPEKLSSKDQEANVLVPPKKADKPKESPAKAEAAAAAPPPTPSVNSDEVLAEFISGKRLGDELKAWTEDNRASLPVLETLVFELLKENQKLNPDPDCAWAEPAKFGAALTALVEDDIVAQMRVLWGIQFYCDKLGFPKLNNESVVQSMFRAMYKYDLADSDAFLEWKEDESDAYSKGKLNAVIQTVDWFNWLEAEDDDEEGDEEEE